MSSLGGAEHMNLLV